MAGDEKKTDVKQRQSSESTMTSKADSLDAVLPLPQRSRGGDACALLILFSCVFGLPVLLHAAITSIPSTFSAFSALPSLQSAIAFAFAIAAVSVDAIIALFLILIWVFNRTGRLVAARVMTRFAVVALIASLLLLIALDGICWLIFPCFVQLVLVVSYQVIQDPLLDVDTRVANPFAWRRTGRVVMRDRNTDRRRFCDWRKKRAARKAGRGADGEHDVEAEDDEEDADADTVGAATASAQAITENEEQSGGEYRNADGIAENGGEGVFESDGESGRRHRKKTFASRMRERASASLSSSAYIPLNFFNVFWIFVVASIVGLGIEMIYCLLANGVWESRAGLLFGPFSPIYGTGAVVMTVALNRFWDRSALIIFAVSAVVGAAVEWGTSYYMEVAFGVAAWDYSGAVGSIGGRTDLAHALAWGLLGLVWVRVLLPGVMGIIGAIPLRLRATLTIIAMALLLVDAAMTVFALDFWSQREFCETIGVPYIPSDGTAQWFGEHFGNAWMEERFANMGFL